MNSLRLETFATGFALAFAMTAAAFAVDSMPAQERRISPEKARNIALDRVRDGHVARAAFRDRQDGQAVYDFTVVDSTNRYDIGVDANSGEVVRYAQKTIFNDNVPAGSENMPASSITPERARTIAMDRVKNGAIVEMDKTFSNNNNRVVYDIEMLGNNSKVDMKIDAETGDIFSYTEKSMEKRSGFVHFESKSFERNLRPISTN